jgi:hypothetical protein
VIENQGLIEQTIDKVLETVNKKQTAKKIRNLFTIFVISK